MITTITATATPKFFKKKLPVEELMELLCQPSAARDKVFIFLFEENDSDTPSRIRVSLTKYQAKLFAQSLLEACNELK